MGNRFRLRISGIIPDMSFQPCGSKDHSHSHDHINPIPKLNQKKPHRYSSLKRHVSSAFASCGITGRSKPALSSSDRELGRTESEPPPQANKMDCFSKWQKEEKYWQLVEITETPRQKVYHSSADENDVGFPPPPPPPSSSENDVKRRRVKQRRKKTRSTRLGPVGRVSTSSVESGIFTSSEIFDDETETLVSSSRSLSTDSASSRRNKRKKRTKTRRLVVESCTAEEAAAARLSVFQRMIPCRVDGKVRESFAVVKRSEDPYEDFKRSMMEMILEKQMFDDDDLELLLHCFLSLNSKDHHGLIVRAFVEIWEALFCGPMR